MQEGILIGVLVILLGIAIAKFELFIFNTTGFGSIERYDKAKLCKLIGRHLVYIGIVCIVFTTFPLYLPVTKENKFLMILQFALYLLIAVRVLRKKDECLKY